MTELDRGGDVVVVVVGGGDGGVVDNCDDGTEREVEVELVVLVVLGS
jgi:hypothetical protein